MSIELIQAAQQALSALEKSQPHPSNPVIGLTNQDFIDHEETIRQLRTAIQQAEAQQPDNTACKSVQKRLAAQQPATTEPVAWLYVEDGEVMFGHPNGYRPADARPLVFGDTHQAPSVPAAVARDAISTVREHYRGTDWGKAAESICDAIDAMLAAK